MHDPLTRAAAAAWRLHLFLRFWLTSGNRTGGRFYSRLPQMPCEVRSPKCVLLARRLKRPQDTLLDQFVEGAFTEPKNFLGLTLRIRAPAEPEPFLKFVERLALDFRCGGWKWLHRQNQ